MVSNLQLGAGTLQCFLLIEVGKLKCTEGLSSQVAVTLGKAVVCHGVAPAAQAEWCVGEGQKGPQRCQVHEGRRGRRGVGVHA